MREDRVCLLCGGEMGIGEPNPHFFCTLTEDLPLDLDFSSANCKAALLSAEFDGVRERAIVVLNNVENRERPRPAA